MWNPEPLWSAFEGIGTAVLAAVGVFAYLTAKGQLAAAVDARQDAVRIAKAQATTTLLKEFGKDRVEFLFGFFDIASDIEDSRAACTALYRDLVVPERNRMRQIASREDRIDLLKAEMLRVIESDIGPDDNTVTDEDRANNFKNKVIEVANRCERAWVLITEDAIDQKFFFADQAYNITSSYFALQDVIADLCKEERFNFDDFRNIAVEASRYMRTHGEYDECLANAVFLPLPEYEPAPLTAMRTDAT